MHASVIGLCGPAGSGKDTIATMLAGSQRHFVRQQDQWRRLTLSGDRADIHDPLIPHCAVIGFADPIKVFAQEVYGFSDQQLWGSSSYRNQIDSRCGVSVRTVLQRFGTEAGRACWDRTWIELGFRHATELRAAGVMSPRGGSVASFVLLPVETVVFCDVRFENEATAIREIGGRTIELIGRGSWSVTGHASELGGAAGKCDLVLDNSGDLEDTRAKLHALVQEHRL